MTKLSEDEPFALDKDTHSAPGIWSETMPVGAAGLPMKRRCGTMNSAGRRAQPQKGRAAVSGDPKEDR